MLTCFHRGAFSPREGKHLTGREAGVVVRVGHGWGRQEIWALFPALCCPGFGTAQYPWPLILQISLKTVGDEEQELSLCVCAAQSAMAPQGHPWHGEVLEVTVMQ